ncbi:MAG: CARDB domain-containing protein [Rhodothermales bacterium]
MCTLKTRMVFFGLVGTLVLGGCGGPGPGGVDLVPVQAPNNPTLCERDQAGNLLLYVKNQGTAEASSSAVEVQFMNVSPGYSPKVRAQGVTGPLQAGATSTSVISAAIPEGCFNPDCDFEITVDIVNEVQETNEQNNSIQGACVG